MCRSVLAFQISARGAFQIAARRVFREGMKADKCKIMEPVMQARFQPCR